MKGGEGVNGLAEDFSGNNNVSAALSTYSTKSYHYMQWNIKQLFH